VPEGFDFREMCKVQSDAAGKPWDNKLHTRTFMELAGREPGTSVEKIAEEPLPYIVSEFDEFIPLKVQMECYNRAGEPKEMILLKGKDHLESYFDDGYEENAAKQTAWLDK
jgi:hypothetical protein